MVRAGERSRRAPLSIRCWSPTAARGRLHSGAVKPSPDVNAERDEGQCEDEMDQRDELQVSSHWQDFIDCVRRRAVPRCGVDRAFEEAAAIFLSVEAYKRNAKVKWDASTETIVTV